MTDQTAPAAPPDTKTVLASKTFWGGILALAASGLSLGNYVLTPTDAAHAVDAITGIAGAVGSLIAIVGRVLATRQVTLPTIKF